MSVPVSLVTRLRTQLPAVYARLAAICSCLAAQHTDSILCLWVISQQSLLSGWPLIHTQLCSPCNHADCGLHKYSPVDTSLLQTHLWQLGRLMSPPLTIAVFSLTCNTQIMVPITQWTRHHTPFSTEADHHYVCFLCAIHRSWPAQVLFSGHVPAADPPVAAGPPHVTAAVCAPGERGRAANAVRGQLADDVLFCRLPLQLLCQVGFSWALHETHTNGRLLHRRPVGRWAVSWRAV